MKVLITDPIDECGIEILRKECDVEFLEQIEKLPEVIQYYDALIVRSRTKVNAEIIRIGASKGKLKVVGRAGVGVDNIDIESAKELGVIVVNAPLGATISVAELTIGMMLALARNIHTADASMKKGKWLKNQLIGEELYGKVLGLIGCGRIGSEVAKRAMAFGMKIIAYDPYLPHEVAKNLGITLTTLDEVLTTSDYISIHAALTRETRNMIGEEELKKMKRTAYIINCARGEIIDENALFKALNEKWIAGAGLDVYSVEPPAKSEITARLLSLPNVLLTPHIGASTKDSSERVSKIIAEEILNALKNQNTRFRVV